MSDLEDVLKNIHSEMAKTLLKRIKDGSATAADLSVARQLLKDNGISAIPKEGSPIGNLAAELPYTGEDDHGFH